MGLALLAAFARLRALPWPAPLLTHHTHLLTTPPGHPAGHGSRPAGVLPGAWSRTPARPLTQPTSGVDRRWQADRGDLAALRFVGEQYAARLDVLAVVLGRLSPGTARDAGRLGDRTVRQRVERWEAAGWAVRRRLLGHTWVLATRAGLRLAGLELDHWTPAVDRLARHHAVP